MRDEIRNSDFPTPIVSSLHRFIPSPLSTSSPGRRCGTIFTTRFRASLNSPFAWTVDVMLSSQAVRVTRLAAPMVAVVATLGLVAWIVVPAWKEHQAVQALLDAVEVYDPQAIEEQTEKLRRMHRGDAAVVPLEQALRDRQGRVRKGAAMALGKLGPEAKAAVPSVIGAMHDPDESVRQMASEAVGQLGYDALMALVESLRSADPELRELAANVLVSLGPDATTLVPAMLEAMADERVRRE